MTRRDFLRGCLGIPLLTLPTVARHEEQPIEQLVITDRITEPGVYGWYTWIGNGLRVRDVTPRIKASSKLHIDPHLADSSVGIRFEVYK